MHAREQPTEDDILINTALRFDGYTYLEHQAAQGRMANNDFRPLMNPVVQTLELHPARLDNPHSHWLHDLRSL